MITRSTPLAIAALARASALAADQVVDVRPERAGVATTYGPHRSVAGALVEFDTDHRGRVLLHLELRYGATVDRVADEVRGTVAAALDEAAPDGAPWRVDLRVTDLVGDDEGALEAPSP